MEAENTTKGQDLWVVTLSQKIDDVGLPEEAIS